MEEKVFIGRGDGYLLSYNIAIDNSFRTEFFGTRAEAVARAEELRGREYIGVNSIQAVNDYWEFRY